jgi:NitT/TauT family transport system substrate-binding protein
MRGQNHSKAISYIIVAIILAIYINLIGTMTPDANAAGEPIRLGFPVWAPNFFCYLAQEKGFFEKNNVEVEITLIQNSVPILNKYADGDLDGIIAVYSDVLFLNSEGVNSKIVYGSDFSGTADVIIGKINTTLADLKGKKISVEGINSFSHLFVLKALENAGLKEGDVEFVDLPGQNVTEGLDKGTIDAGHTYEPYTTQALKKGYKILFAAGNIPGIITNVIAFHPNVVDH